MRYGCDKLCMVGNVYYEYLVGMWMGLGLTIIFRPDLGMTLNTLK